VTGLLGAGRALAQVTMCDCEQPNSGVRALASSGNTIYLGGDFTQIGRPTGGLLGLDPTSAALVVLPKVLGTVYAMAPDGTGGWFIGGSFTYVGGALRSNLAHIASDGSVLSW